MSPKKKKVSKKVNKRKVNKFRKRFTLKNIKKTLFSKEALKVYLVIAGAFLTIILGIFGWVAKDLPSPDKVNDRLAAQSTIIYAANNEPIWEIHGEKNRTLVDFNDMPQYLKDATVAIEDKDFYHHGGFNVKRTVKALIVNTLTKKKEQGGSTITQQLIKNTVLTNEKTYTRKMKELILAIEIEQMYSKDDILKMYLNEIPYGSNAYGAEAGSKTYFDKKATELKEKNPENLARCAMLAALPNAPTYYSPYGQNYNDLLERKNWILDLMVEQKKVTQEEVKAAKNVDLKKILINRSAIDGYGDIKFPHFSLYAKEKLVEKYGEKMATQGGLRVYTTLDWDKQNYALSLLDPKEDKFGLVKTIKNGGASNAGLVSLDPKTGNILAMVGSLDFRDEAIDGYVNITTSRRQPGSSIKPVVYANAWKKNWGPGSIIYDLSTDFGGGYKPNNYNGNFNGPVPMRKALDGSLNIPAVKTLYLGGITEMLDTANSMGISSYDKNRTFADANGKAISMTDYYSLPMALGSAEVRPIELASAYATFANMGEKQDINWFTKVTDSKGKIIDENKPVKGKQVLNPEIAYSMNDVLSDNGSRAWVFGANNYLNIPGKKVGAKSGTTEANHDAWTAGYSRNIATVVWVGNNNNTAMKKHADGSVVAGPIWNAFMKKYADNDGWEKEKPKGIKYVELDARTGKKPVAGATTVKDIFPSWYKLEEAGGTTSTFKIDKISRKLATPNCPEEAVEEVKISNVTAEIPAQDPSYARWNGPIAAWASSHGLSAGGANFIPTEPCDIHDGTNLPGITLSNMFDGKSVPENFEVKASVVAPRGVGTVTIYVDEKAYNTQNVGGGTYSAQIAATKGEHQIKAKVRDAHYYTATSETVKISVTQIETTLELEFVSSLNQLVATTNSDKITKIDFIGVKENGEEKSLSATKDVVNREAKINFTNNGAYVKIYAIGNPGSTDEIKSNEIEL